MTEKKTVTVAGVPVTVTIADGALGITAGRFDPSAAAGWLHRHPRTGTSAVGIFIADETGDTAHKPDHRWFFELYPAPPGQPGTLLLCDGCYQAATGTLAQCEDDCPHEDPGHTGLCYRASTSHCQWCGTEDRLHEACRDAAARRLPTAGEQDEGQWWLHFTGAGLGPYPSQQAAWDDWHATLHPGTTGARKGNPA
jgi:hypothetical protein